MDGLQDEVGLCAVFGDPRAAELVRAGLAELTHRGGGATTLVASDGERLHAARSAAGPVTLPDVDASAALGAIGPGATGTDAVFVGRWAAGPSAVALSGRIARSGALRKEAEARGAVFTTEGAAELLLHQVAASAQKSAVNRLVDALQRVDGAYATVWLGIDRLVAVRDPRGVRPLCWGRVGAGAAIASESSALVALGATSIRDLEPGEMLVAADGSVHTLSPFPRRARAICLREWTSVARVDSSVAGVSVHAAREVAGELLFRDFPVPTAEAVTGLPGDPGASGFARASRLPLVPLLAGNPEHPTVIEVAARGRRLVLVVSELVSGEPVRAVVGRLRAAGATEVHLRVASPPTRALCPYGVGGDRVVAVAVAERPLPDRLASWLGADSVQFVNAAALRAALSTAAGQPLGLCEACFGGSLPAALDDPKSQLDLFGRTP